MPTTKEAIDDDEDKDDTDDTVELNQENGSRDGGGVEEDGDWCVGDSIVARETVSISFVDVRISGIVIAVVVVVVRPGRVAPTIRRRRGPGRTGGGGGGGRIDDGGTRSNMVTTNR